MSIQPVSIQPRKMTDQAANYLPAAGHDWALPLYDPIVKLLGGDKARKALLDQAAVQPGQRVLDIGCGTGTLAVMIKRFYPGVEVTGLDPDPKALRLAARKAKRAGGPVRFDQGSADALPYADGSFDRVFSSFMLHHLQADRKGAAMREVCRVLAPGGSFHVLDFEQPGPSAGGVAQWAHSHKHFGDNTEERILGLMRQAGFRSFEKRTAGKMLFGLLRTASYQAGI